MNTQSIGYASERIRRFSFSALDVLDEREARIAKRLPGLMMELSTAWRCIIPGYKFLSSRQYDGD